MSADCFRSAIARGGEADAGIGGLDTGEADAGSSAQRLDRLDRLRAIGDAGFHITRLGDERGNGQASAGGNAERERQERLDREEFGLSLHCVIPRLAQRRFDEGRMPHVRINRCAGAHTGLASPGFSFQGGPTQNISRPGGLDSVKIHRHLGCVEGRRTIMDPKKLLEQFLGPNAAGNMGDLANTARDKLGQVTKGGFPGGALGGVAAGGLLALLLGGKNVGKLAGAAVRYGGMAALGALAYKAWQNSQGGAGANQPTGAGQPPAQLTGPSFEGLESQNATDGKPFALALVRAMIAAANADGHIGADEQKQIFDKANELNLAADEKAFIFDAMAQPASAAQIASLAASPHQAAELYAAARLSINPDHPDEKEFLETLEEALRLPAGFAAELEKQVAVTA